METLYFADLVHKLFKQYETRFPRLAAAEHDIVTAWVPCVNTVTSRDLLNIPIWHRFLV